MSKKVFILGMMAFLSLSVPETKAADFGFSLFGPQGGQFSFYNGSSFSNRAYQYRRPVYSNFHFRILFVCQDISSSQIGKVINTVVSLVNDIARDQTFVQTSPNSRFQPSGDSSQ